MTEQEWRECTDPDRMLTFLQERAEREDGRGCVSCACCRVRCRRREGFCPAYRKLRLFTRACCDRILTLLSDPTCRGAVRALERYIEGEIDANAFWREALEFDKTRRGRFPKYATPDDGAWNALYCAVHRRWMAWYDDTFAERRWRLASAVMRDAVASAGADEAGPHARLLRDRFGDLFRPSSVNPAWLAWNDGTVRKLAQVVYEERAFDRLPLLADGLEDAGCTDADLLGHLRGPRPHVRGCWAVDLILDKQ